MSWKSVIALIFVLCERSANMDKKSRSAKTMFYSFNRSFIHSFIFICSLIY